MLFRLIEKVLYTCWGMIHARNFLENCENETMPVLTFICVVLALISGVSSDIGYFWHITDIHWDPTYTSLGLSCEGAPENQEAVGDHGIYGDYNCDSPWRLVYSVVEGMRGIKPDADFVVWTGDTIPDISNDQATDNVVDAIQGNVTYLIKETLSGTPVYPTLGQRDVSAAFPDYSGIYEKWRSWIGDENEETFIKGGYYATKTMFGMIVVGLNTNLYYRGLKRDTVVPDPSDQFKWLMRTLISARINSEKVLIVGHTPPGINPNDGEPWMYEQYNKRLNAVLMEHNDVIIGMVFGHEHSDNFRVYRNEKGEGTFIQFVAPSVTPKRNQVGNMTFTAHNPGIRLYTYDRLTGVILDYVQYYLDLTMANTETFGTWEEEYSAKSAYGLHILLPSSALRLAEAMRNKSSVAFKQYFKFWTVNVSDIYMNVCDEQCHAKFYCNYIFQNYDEYLDCYDGYFSPPEIANSNSVGSHIVFDWFAFMLLSITSHFMNLL